MPEKKKSERTPGELYDRRASALAAALEAQRDKNPDARGADRSFRLAQDAKAAIAKARSYGYGAASPLAAGESGASRLPPLGDMSSVRVLAQPQRTTQQMNYGRPSTFVSGYDDQEAMLRMLMPQSRAAMNSASLEKARSDIATEEMRELFARPGEGRGTFQASDLPLTTRQEPAQGQIMREPGGRSGLISVPFGGDYEPSYDWERELFSSPTIPLEEGGVSRFMPERLPQYRQSLRHATAYERDLREQLAGRDREPTKEANRRFKAETEKSGPFMPGELDRLAGRKPARKKK